MITFDGMVSEANRDEHKRLDLRGMIIEPVRTPSAQTSGIRSHKDSAVMLADNEAQCKVPTLAHRTLGSSYPARRTTWAGAGCRSSMRKVIRDGSIWCVV